MIAAVAAAIEEDTPESCHEAKRATVVISPALATSIPADRLMLAVRVLARRFVDRALSELEEATDGNG